jgi:hypothetical protein
VRSRLRSYFIVILIVIIGLANKIFTIITDKGNLFLYIKTNIPK